MSPRRTVAVPENPYGLGTLYHLIFALLTGPRRLTRDELTLLTAGAAGEAIGKARHSVWVVISPNREDGPGDCRGNASSQGHLYYVEEDADGRLQAHSRVTPLEPRRRPGRRRST